jgi:hypothetical protein
MTGDPALNDARSVSSRNAGQFGYDRDPAFDALLGVLLKQMVTVVAFSRAPVDT